MSTSLSYACAALFAFGVLAAASIAEAAGPPEPSPAYWIERRIGSAAEQATLKRMPGQINRSFSKGAAQIAQIDPRAARVEGEWGFFEVCSFHRLPGLEMTPAPFCKAPPIFKAGGFADALIGPPTEETAPVLRGAGIPVVSDVPPVAYLWQRRVDFTVPEDELELDERRAASTSRTPCNGDCRHLQAIFQVRRRGGTNMATEYQSGPGAAVIVQEADGAVLNAALIAQWGGDNQAVLIQAASVANNVSSVTQIGNRNGAFANQH